MIVLVYNEWIGMMKFPNNKKMMFQSTNQIGGFTGESKVAGKIWSKMEVAAAGKNHLQEIWGFDEAKVGV